MQVTDGKPALKHVQEEVKRIRREPTATEDSIVGDSRATGAAEQAVKALGEYFWVHVLESRLGARSRGPML